MHMAREVRRGAAERISHVIIARMGDQGKATCEDMEDGSIGSRAAMKHAFQVHVICKRAHERQAGTKMAGSDDERLA